MKVFTGEAGFTHEAGLRYGDKDLNRLNARFQVFMAPFGADFEGRSVLDLASHDGRWSYAALKLGAARVVGIEGRQALIAKGGHLFAETPDRATFIAGDIFEVMPALQQRGERFDIVLCLGIFYHIADHLRLLRLIRTFDPTLVILDTSLIDDEAPFVTLQTERHDNLMNAIAVGDESDAVIGIPSKGGLGLMARSLGYELTYLDWNAAQLESKVGLDDYFAGGPGERRRFSAVLRKP